MLILSELLELMINCLIYKQHHHFLIEHMKLLEKKTLLIKFIELRNPIILYFTKNKVHIFNDWNNLSNCSITTNVYSFLLLLIKNFNQKIKINNIYCKISGDIELIRYFTEILRVTQKNIFHYLYSTTINKICYTNYRFFTYITKKNNILQECLKFALTDEWKLIPHALELLQFYKRIKNLQKKETLLLKYFKKLKEM